MLFGGVIVVVLCGIVAGIVLHRIIGLYIEGSITGQQCLLICGGYLGLIISIIIAPSASSRIILILLLISAVICLPLLFRRFEDRSDRAFYERKIEEFRAAIVSDPMNLAARSRLAETLHKIERLDEAIAELSEVVRLSPQSIPDAHRLKQLMEEKEGRETPTITCPGCGEPNPPERTHCLKCEGTLRMSSEIKEWLVRGGLKQIVIVSSVSMAVIAVIALSLSALSWAVRILVIAVFLVIVILAELLYLYRSL